MERDGRPLTPKEKQQFDDGQSLALMVAVHALIASHPDRAAFDAKLANLSHHAGAIFSTGVALQQDQGMRQAFSEAIDAFHATASSG